MMTNERTYQIIIGILIIIIIIGGWFAFGRSTSPSVAGSDMSATSSQQGMSTSSMNGSTLGSGQMIGSATSGSTVVSGTDSVSVANQAAGAKVQVSSVTLSAPGWVAVKDSTGRTLGAAFWQAGTFTNVWVPLLRGTVHGGQYQVLLYADNGDKKFELRSDSIVMNSDGAIVGATFTAN